MSNAIVNLRDVGEFVNYLSGSSIMAEKKLYRGGKIESVECLAQAGYPKTIVNLRASPDKIEKDQGLIQYHYPIADSIEKYDTQLGDVRKWLNGVVSTLSRDDLEFPVAFAILKNNFRRDTMGYIRGTSIFYNNVCSLFKIEKEYNGFIKMSKKRKGKYQ